MLQSHDPIFVDETTGRPLKFAITLGNHKAEARALIEKYGGEVAKNNHEDGIFMKLTGPDVDNPTLGWYSTEYVTDCVQQGMLLDRQRYSMDIKGKATGRRTTRNHFSSADEQILRDHLKNADYAHASGNTLYIELAKTFPQHTAQSWRHHAVKILPSLRKTANGTSTSGNERKPRRPVFTAHETAVLREALLRADPQEYEAVFNVIGDIFTAPSRTLESWMEHGTGLLASAAECKHFEGPDVPLENGGTGKARNPFIVREKEMIREAAKKDAHAIQANASSYWKAFATKHPSHTWEAWKEHYNKKMLPVFNDADQILKVAKKSLAQHAQGAATDEDELPAASNFLGFSVTGGANPPPQPPFSLPLINAETSDSERDEPVPMTQAPGHPSDISEDEDTDPNALDPIWKVTAETPADNEDFSSAGETTSQVKEAATQRESEDSSAKTSAPGDESAEDVANSQEAHSPPVFYTQCASAPSSDVEDEEECAETTTTGAADAHTQAPLFEAQDEEKGDETTTTAGADATNHEPIPLVGATEQELEEMLETQAMLTQGHNVQEAEEKTDADSAVHRIEVRELDSTEAPLPTQQRCTLLDAESVPSLPKRSRETTQNVEILPAKRKRRGSVDLLVPLDKRNGSPSSVAASPRLATARVRDRYLNRFDRMCALFEHFTRRQCAQALHAASGNFARAHALLEVNFILGDVVDNAMTRSIFTRAEDDVILARNEEAMAELAARQGRDSVAERAKFLEQYTRTRAAS
ncbi:hypothetical protein HDU87_005472 [Geranomyces variabilis]|uniref:DNA-binding protein RAP1 n=1 Tax=Geranomyces variabilis TaxID=109894 RepID=A0AAD5XLP9_9FUNG|nr:hypothetical protein HDU87_005472 [Geranomyces variabilis]